MTMIRRCRQFVLPLMAIVTAACRDSQAPVIDNPPIDTLPVLGELVVSNPVTPALPAVQAAGTAAITTVYVSMPPGTIPAATYLVFHPGSPDSVVVQFEGGGFDPVAIQTDADSLVVALYLARDTVGHRFVARVPATRPPVVVRTDPSPGRRDVPLNALVRVVFSEPVAPASLTGGSVRLLKDGLAVTGSVAVSGADGLLVTFTPDAALDPVADYQLVLTGVADLSGQVMEGTLAVDFVTRDAGAEALPPVAYERATPHAAAGHHSRFILYDGDSVELINESPGGTVVIAGTVSRRGDFLTLTFPGGEEFRPREAYGRLLGDTWLAIAYNWVMITDGFEEGMYTSAPDTAAPAPLPPQSGQIAFVRAGRIWLLNTATGATAPLTAGPDDYDPAWSPDGSRIAFARSGAAPGLYLINADGTNLVRRTISGAQPAWSPSGQQIVFADFNDSVGVGAGSTDLYLISAADDGSSAIDLTGTQGWEMYPAWSPAGNHIVFASDWLMYDIAADIFRMIADGSQRSTLGSSGLENYQPAWSPDGQHIAMTSCSWSFNYCSASIVEVMAASGTGPHNFLAAGSGFAHPSWSPDGQYLAYSASGNLHWVRADGTARGIIMADGHSPAWRP